MIHVLSVGAAWATGFETFYRGQQCTVLEALPLSQHAILNKMLIAMPFFLFFR